jgi:capsular polysaccharide transport system ATP-binding protein
VAQPRTVALDSSLRASCSSDEPSCSRWERLVISLRDVSKHYPMAGGTRAILRHVNLKVRPGERVGILGCNGAGKSTLVRLIGGTESPTEGTITRSMSVSWPLAFAGGVQGSLTGLDNLRFICRIYAADYARARDFVEDFSELGRYLREPVRTYSNGMRARLAFAMSMAVEFDCFLIDEVIAVGDQRFHEKCHEELFVKRADRAMIVVSHSAEFVRQVCSRAAVLHKGRLRVFDSIDSAFAFYRADLARSGGAQAEATSAGGEPPSIAPGEVPADAAAVDAPAAHERLQMSADAFVRDLYLRILGREPDAGGHATYVQALRERGPLEGPASVVRAMINSDEFKRRAQAQPKAEPASASTVN